MEVMGDVAGIGKSCRRFDAILQAEGAPLPNLAKAFDELLDELEAEHHSKCC